jgi:hypothetical protein
MNGSVILVIILILVAVPVAGGYLYSENAHYAEAIGVVQTENSNLTASVSDLRNQLASYEKENEADQTMITELENENSQLRKQVATTSTSTAPGKQLGLDGWETVPTIPILLVTLVMGGSVTYSSYMWINRHNLEKHITHAGNEVLIKVTKEEADCLIRNRRKQYL